MPVPFLESAVRAVFHASWQAAVLSTIVLLATRLVPRLPAAAKSGFWLIVLARLLFPLTPQSSWSLFNLTRFSTGPSAVTPGAVETQIGTDRSAPLRQANLSEVSIPAAPGPLTFARSEPQNSKTISTDAPAPDERPGVLVGNAPSLVGVVSLIWALGVAIVMASGVHSWYRLRRLLRACRVCADESPLAILEACRRESGLRRKVTLSVSEADVAPALAGIVSPRIIVSAKALSAIGAAELEWLFRHELAHIRRWDLAVSRLWWCARAVHWFNPLVWWAASRARVDAELACDEWVIERAAVSERAAYGRTLLTVAELLGNTPSVPAAAGISLGEPVLSRRIRAIAGYRPASRGVRLAVAAVLVGVAGMGLTDATENLARGAAGAESPPATPGTKAAEQSASVRGAVRPTFGLPADAQGRPQLAAVLDAWQRGRERLKSYDVYLTFETSLMAKQSPWPTRASFEVVGPPAPGSMPTPASQVFGLYGVFDLSLVPKLGIMHLPQRATESGDMLSRHVCSGGKLRIEEGIGKPGEKPADIVSVWDGELAKCALPRVKEFSVSGSRARFAACYEYERASCANGSDMIDVLRLRSGTVIEGTDEKGIVVYTPAPQPFGYRVWLDPAKGFQPTRIHRLLKVDGTLITDMEQENTLDEVVPGVWAPVKFVVSLYSQSKKTATPVRRPESVQVITLNRKYSRFNVPIDESLFQLPVPAGFQVGDDICHRVYQFGKAKTSLTQISQWVLEGKMSAKDYKEFVKRSGIANAPVQNEVKLD